MNRVAARSTYVIETSQADAGESTAGAWERFEALYRASRDDIYA
jgi:hypothetical protein